MTTTKAPELGKRERQVVDLIEAGLSNKLIAFKMGTSYGTVRTQVARIFKKVGVGSRTELARWSVETRRKLASIEAMPEKFLITRVGTEYRIEVVKQ